MNTVLTIIVALLIFGVLIISHEFGHFIAAKKSGVDVIEFSVGMGPLIYQKKKKETDYSIRLLPIGGYCKMKGEDDEGDDIYEDGSLFAAPAWKRVIIMAAGAINNFIIAIIIFFIIYCMIGTDASTTIGAFSDISPAYEAGMEIGDTIVSINGGAIKEWDDITSYIREGDGSTLTIVIKSASGETKTFTVSPYYEETEGVYLIGIHPAAKTNVWHAFIDAIKMTGIMIAEIWGIFVGLFRGQVGMEAFSGPIGATVVIGQYLHAGLVYLLSIAGSISVSLGFFNLLPIPALDGSHILFTLVEWIHGKPINRKVENRIHLVGFALLLVLAIVIAYKDIVNLF